MRVGGGRLVGIRADGCVSGQCPKYEQIGPGLKKEEEGFQGFSPLAGS